RAKTSARVDGPAAARPNAGSTRSPPGRPNVRIAHLTDPHVPPAEDALVPARAYLSKRWMGGLNLALGRGKRHRLELLEAAIAEINREAYEHVVVTGDLTNLSLESEFARAAEILGRIEGGPARTTILPGNHHAYTY